MIGSMLDADSLGVLAGRRCVRACDACEGCTAAHRCGHGGANGHSAPPVERGDNPGRVLLAAVDRLT